MSILRKTKRNMAQKQLKEEGKRRVNARFKIPNAPSGKIGKNGRYNVRVSNSDFALDWKAACDRRVKTFKQLNTAKKKARAK